MTDGKLPKDIFGRFEVFAQGEGLSQTETAKAISAIKTLVEQLRSFHAEFSHQTSRVLMENVLEECARTDGQTKEEWLNGPPLSKTKAEEIIRFVERKLNEAFISPFTLELINKRLDDVFKEFVLRLGDGSDLFKVARAFLARERSSRGDAVFLGEIDGPVTPFEQIFFTVGVQFGEKLTKRFSAIQNG